MSTCASDLIEKYKRIREISVKLTGPIVDLMPRFVLMKAARDLGMLRDGKMLVCDSETDTHYLIDRYYYDIYWQRKNLVGHFLESDAYRQLTEEEQRVVQGMNTAYYSLFEILDVDPIEATLRLDDLLGEKTYTIMDINLSLTAVEGHLLAARVKQIEGIAMTTGPVCPFKGDRKEALLGGLRPRRTSARRGKRRKKPRRIKRSDYGVYFYRQHRQIGEIAFEVSEETDD